MKYLFSLLFLFSTQSFADAKFDIALYCELKHYSSCTPFQDEEECGVVKAAENRGDIEGHKGTLYISNNEEGFSWRSQLISIVNNISFFILLDWEVTDNLYIFRGKMNDRDKPNLGIQNKTTFTIDRYTGELFYRMDMDNSHNNNTPNYFTYTYNCKKIEKKF